MENIQIPENGFYAHYKHDIIDEDIFNYVYEVVGMGRNTEDKTYTVLYRPMYKNDWMLPATYQSRPLELFIGNETYNGEVVPRFTRITDPKAISDLEVRRKEMYGV